MTQQGKQPDSTPLVKPTRKTPTRDQLQIFHRALKSTLHPEMFGLGYGDEDVKQQPIPRNSKHNPLSRIMTSPLTGHQYRIADTYARHMLRHLMGARALFVVNRPDRRIELLTPDIDATENATYEETSSYGRCIVMETWGIDEPWVESGRSAPRKWGAYPRLKIDWGDTGGMIVPQTRRVALNLVNAELRKRYRKDEHANFHFDAIKGGTSYIEPNPKYDPEYAASIDPRPAKMYNVERFHDDDTPWNAPAWLSRYETRKLLKQEGRGIPHDEIETIIDGLSVEYQDQTRAEAYEREKHCYGYESKTGKINKSVKFDRCERLEPTRRHYAMLITAPCLSRPETAEAYEQWLKSKRGQITWRKYISILPAEVRKLLIEHHEAIQRGDYEGGREIERQISRIGRPVTRPPATPTARNTAEQATPAAPIVIPQEISELAQRLLNHAMQAGGADAHDIESGDCFAAKKAAARIALRHVKCEGDETTQLTTEIYYATGLSDGMTPGDVDSRMTDSERFVEFATRDFHPAGRGAGSLLDQVLSPKSIKAAARHLMGRMSRKQLAEIGIKGEGMSPWMTAAPVFLGLAHNILTGERRNVPATSVPHLLGGRDYGRFARLKRLFIDCNLIIRTVDGCRHFGHCDQFMFTAHAYIPEALEHLIGEDVQVAESVNSADCGREADASAVTAAALLSLPPDNLYGRVTPMSESEYGSDPAVAVGWMPYFQTISSDFLSN